MNTIDSILRRDRALEAANKALGAEGLPTYADLQEALRGLVATAIMKSPAELHAAVMRAEQLVA